MKKDKKVENKKDGRSRKWFLTINNYSEDEYQNAIKNMNKCKYSIVCKEVGKKSEVPHIHCWFHYENDRNFSTIKKLFPRANIQVGIGSDEQVYTYLTKEGVFLEHGTKEIGQGKRTDMSLMREAINDGKSMSDIIDIARSLQSIKTAELILKYKEKERYLNKGELSVIWIYGGAGLGKTKQIFDLYYKTGKLFRPTSYKWWEGYDGHEVVLIDDWRPEWCSFDDLLTLTDLYPFRVECKGGTRQVQYNKIYFTSNKHPRDYFRHLTDNEYKQLERRLTKVIKYFMLDGKAHQVDVSKCGHVVQF